MEYYKKLITNLSKTIFSETFKSFMQHKYVPTETSDPNYKIIVVMQNRKGCNLSIVLKAFHLRELPFTIQDQQDYKIAEN